MILIEFLVNISVQKSILIDKIFELISQQVIAKFVTLLLHLDWKIQ